MVLDLPPVPAGNDGPDVELGVLQLEEGSLELEELNEGGAGTGTEERQRPKSRSVSSSPIPGVEGKGKGPAATSTRTPSTERPSRIRSRRKSRQGTYLNDYHSPSHPPPPPAHNSSDEAPQPRKRRHVRSGSGLIQVTQTRRFNILSCRGRPF